MTPLAEILDSRTFQAFIAGVFVAAGWIVNGWQNRREERRRRRERLRDVHRALFAEIGAWLATVGDIEELNAQRDTIIGRTRADPGFVPFLAQQQHDRVYAEVLSEIHILPRTSIDIVVAYYSQIAAIRALIEDMGSDRYAHLPPERRIAIYQDYIRMTRVAFDYGRAALRLIDVFAKEGKLAARAEQLRLRELNIRPAGDRSDRSRGGGSA